MELIPAKRKSPVQKITNSYADIESVYLALPPHIFSIQLKSGPCCITGHWGRVQNEIKKPNPNPNLLLPVVFHNKICVFIMIFMALSFFGIFTTYFIYEEVMSVRLYV